MNAKNKSEKKIFLTFLGGVLLCGLAGGSVSVLFQTQEKDIAERLRQAGVFVSQNALYMEIFFFLLCGICAIFFYQRAKHFIRHGDLDNEEIFEKTDWNLGIGLGFVVVSVPLLLIFFGMVTVYTHSDAFLLGNIIFFLAAVACNVYLQWLFINCTKKLYPEKRGSIFDKRFEKEWMDSSDEAEKWMTYKAAYETHKKMQFLFIGMFLLLFMFSLVIPVGVTAYLIMGVLWIGNIVIYVYESLKVSKQKLRG